MRIRKLYSRKFKVDTRRQRGWKMNKVQIFKEVQILHFSRTRQNHFCRNKTVQRFYEMQLFSKINKFYASKKFRIKIDC